ncbi:putative pre-mRNA-splicing factor ATP-dependent RNA helicase [Micractinium conductrix]|uniref:Pre-mRNA-splicing factor ATP-dependent RNA helicase n=1 Tax=Micractinium conductrix TaxID=554055 RepID=A0A2P6V2H1_9CHLO|nr:putative pre-mRNA-splicing factor ATP-dependent RNA helicase [Micractinium conductrix]|eukprot:PSC68289.1 putative pre-mRNA-splicing factor ATP-dependent RNA helicase [Micractinium conductrix]
MEEEMLAEASAKAEQSAAAERQRSHEGAGERGRDGRDGDRDRNVCGGGYDRRDRSRSRDRDRRRRSSRSRSRERYRRARSRSASPRGAGRGAPAAVPDEPEMYGCYKGRVTGAMDFGCFVELQGFRTKQEGLVHLSNISSTKRGGSAKELVNKGEPVWVKVVSKTGQRLGLAMRDVDQVTGEDLLPMQRGAANPSGPGGGGPGGAPSALHGLSGIKVGAG